MSGAPLYKRAELTEVRDAIDDVLSKGYGFAGTEADDTGRGARVDRALAALDWNGVQRRAEVERLKTLLARVIADDGMSLHHSDDFDCAVCDALDKDIRKALEGP